MVTQVKVNPNDPRVKRTRQLLKQALGDLLTEKSFHDITTLSLLAQGLFRFDCQTLKPNANAAAQEVVSRGAMLALYWEPEPEVQAVFSGVSAKLL